MFHPFPDADQRGYGNHLFSLTKAVTFDRGAQFQPEDIADDSITSRSSRSDEPLAVLTANIRIIDNKTVLCGDAVVDLGSSLDREVTSSRLIRT